MAFYINNSFFFFCILMLVDGGRVDMLHFYLATLFFTLVTIHPTFAGPSELGGQGGQSSPLPHFVRNINKAIITRKLWITIYPLPL